MRKGYSFIDGYRKYSKLQKPVPREVDLAAVINEMRQFYPQVEWHNNVHEPLIVRTDPNLLRQILINLIKNAIEAGANKLWMECTKSLEGKVSLYASNNGEPIPADMRSSIFIPFFTTKRSGNGIGLSLSRCLLTIHGGMMSLIDNPYSVFTTTFLL